MKQPPSVEDVIEIVRNFLGLPASRVITADTRIRQDLGVDGDDGDDLIREIEDRYLFSFVPEDGKWWEVFEVEPDSVFFGSEAFGWVPEGSKLIPLTIGMLHRAVLRRLYFSTD